MANRSGDGLRQAENDFLWARDAFAEGAPFEYFDEDQAREALGFAQAFLERARGEAAGGD